MGRNKHIRAAVAWVCLGAVALLYAPLAVAALVANGVDCCAGGYCKIPEHHHHQRKVGQEHSAVAAGAGSLAAPAADSSHTDCGHEMSGLKPCSMSCCQDPARPALTPSAFLLPPVNFVPATFEVIRSVQVAKSFEPSRFEEPLSPPPRLDFSIL